MFGIEIEIGKFVKIFRQMKDYLISLIFNIDVDNAKYILMTKHIFCLYSVYINVWIIISFDFNILNIHFYWRLNFMILKKLIQRSQLINNLFIRFSKSTSHTFNF